ncbi:MAG: TetR/AcrR family transcriptional regulator [Archangium sp.]|nr:TetR/AcrR family transcriptional regulator [Archangium sp.]
MAKNRVEHIIEVALKVLETEGPRALTQTRVAKAAGLQQGHLTYYFPKRADLVEAVLAHFVDAGRAPFVELLGGGPKRRGKAALVKHVRAQLFDVKRSRALLGLVVEGFDDADVMRGLVDRNQQNRDFMAAFLGLSPTSVEVELAVAMIQGLGVNHVMRPYGPTQADALMGAMLRLFGEKRASKRRRARGDEA